MPEGPVLYSVTGADCPGLSVIDVEEKLVGQLDGCVEPRLKVFDEQPEESLLITESA